MKHLISFCTLLALPTLLSAQTSSAPSFMPSAIVEHSTAGGTVTANAPRPLRQVIEAVSQEYGWIVDYEDPVYRSKFDLVDSTDPTWRANNPNAKGAVRVAGGSFQSNFPEPSSTSGVDAENQVLQKLVADYNASGNPGKFVVRQESGGRFAVVGVLRRNDVGENEPFNAPLDVTISIPVQTRTARETLKLIVDSIIAATGVDTYFSTGFSSDPLQGAEVTVGGSDVPARDLLVQTLNEVSKTSPNFRETFVYQLFYHPASNVYSLDLRTATKKVIDERGRQGLKFIDFPRN
jgi:hypothetical protein